MSVPASSMSRWPVSRMACTGEPGSWCAITWKSCLRRRPAADPAPAASIVGRLEDEPVAGAHEQPGTAAARARDAVVPAGEPRSRRAVIPPPRPAPRRRRPRRAAPRRPPPPPSARSPPTAAPPRRSSWSRRRCCAARRPAPAAGHRRTPRPGWRARPTARAGRRCPPAERTPRTRRRCRSPGRRGLPGRRGGQRLVPFDPRRLPLGIGSDRRQRPYPRRAVRCLAALAVSDDEDRSCPPSGRWTCRPAPAGSSRPSAVEDPRRRRALGRRPLSPGRASSVPSVTNTGGSVPWPGTALTCEPAGIVVRAPGDAWHRNPCPRAPGRTARFPEPGPGAARRRPPPNWWRRAGWAVAAGPAAPAAG